MSEPIVSIDSSEIREGKLQELRTAIKELVEFVDANEPQPIVYSVYLNENGTRMTIVQVHPDSASMEFHMRVAGPVFSTFTELITLTTIDIYGKPSDTLLEQMRQKGRMLGNAAPVVHDLHAGFARFGAR